MAAPRNIRQPALDTLMQTARSAYLAGRREEAESCLLKILARDPANPAAWNNLGSLVAEMGRIADAETAYRKAIAINPAMADFHANLGNILKDSNRPQEAEAAYREALRLQPGLAPAMAQLAQLLREAGRFSESEKMFREALELAPGLAMAHNNLGILLKQLDRRQEAESAWRRALELEPGLAEAINNLGILLLEDQKYSEAEAAFRSAIQIRADFADAYANLGNLLRSTGQDSDAEASYRHAIRLRPDFARAYNNLGILLNDLGRAGEAEAAYQSAIEREPDAAETYNNLGGLLLGAGRLDEAEAAFRRAIELKPDTANAQGNLGNLLKLKDRPFEAEAAYRRAIELDPDDVGSCNNLAILLYADHRVAEAEATFRHAIDVDPDYADALNNLGNLLKDSGRMREAEEAYRSILRQNPDFPEALNNLGVMLSREKRFAEAETSLRRALELKPDFVDAYSNLGNLLKQTGHLVEAEAAYRRALELHPGNAEARLNLGLLLLSLGRYAEAWPYHEARYFPDTKERRAFHPQLPFPQWQGESLRGKTLLVYSEQGHGDNIQFVRYAPLLKAAGVARLTLVQVTTLVPLIRTAADIDEVVDNLGAVANHDYWCFPLSVPLHLGTTTDNIPADLPYLRALPERIARWRDRLPRDGFKVGLVWKGNPQHKEDIHRSIPSLAALSSLWRIPGVSFVSLQKGAGEDEAHSPPPGQPLMHLGADITDFADTAAIVAQLDLVISVDSAVAHVAGALAKPVWVLLPAVGTDWRWLRDRTDSPWYPGVMRLFRQQIDEDWEQVAAKVAAALWTQVAGGEMPVSAQPVPAPKLPAAPIAPPLPLPVATPTGDPFSEALAALRGGRPDEAEAILRRFLEGSPEDAGGWNNLGNLLQDTGRLDDAEAAFGKAIELAGDRPEFHVNLGNLQKLRQQLSAAEAAYRRALDIQPHNAATHNLLGALLKLASRPNEAEAAYRRALELDPGLADAHNNLGILLKDEARVPEAEAAYRQALALRPDFSEAHNNLGILLLEAERFDEAEAAFQRAIELRPDYSDLYSNLGNLLKQAGKFAEAQTAYRRAIALNPRDAMAHNNLGVLLQEAENLVEAEAAYRHALEAKPNFGEAVANQGILHQHLDQVAQAEAAYRQAIELKPDCTDAKLNLGLLLLGLGRYAEAWPWHEARHFPDSKARKAMQPRFAFPQWQGEPLTGKSLVVVLEQGYGDNIQFARYAPVLKARGLARLSFLQPAALIPLLATARGIDFITPDAGTVPLHDYWCFPLSIPLHLGTTLENIPDALPYLWVLPERAEHWRPRLPAGIRIGLVWKGNAEHKNDARRSLPGVSSLAPLWDVPGVSFVSLQKGEGEDEAKAASRTQSLLHLGSEIRDFADTAAIVAQLDLLITIDSATAHLAGALGKPVWVLLPGIGCDWRWLRERGDSPWYPRVMRLFRQPRTAESWEGTIRGMAAALHEWIAERGRASASAAHAEPLPLLDHALPDMPVGLIEAPERQSAAVPSAAVTPPPTPSAFPSATNPEDFLQAAHAAYLGGRHDEAEALLRRFLEQDPGNSAAWNNLGIILQEHGQDAAAEAAYRRAVAAQPEIPDYYVSLGNFLKTTGRSADAETAYRQALATNPEHPTTLTALAQLLKETQRLADAEALLRQAMAIEPSRATAMAQLAQVFKETQRPTEAEAMFNAALALDPTLVEAHNNLGILLLEVSRPAEAEACFRKAVAIDDSFAAGHGNLGNALKAQKQPAAAEASYRRALSLTPDDLGIMNNLGVLLGSEERKAEAEAILRQITVIAPDYADGWNNLGNALQDLERFADAEAAYRRALELNPVLAAGHSNLGNALRAQERLADAEASYRAALELNPEDTNTLNNLAVLLLGLRRHEDARLALARALELLPDFSAAWCNIGNVFQELASADEAEAAYRKAIEFNPDFTDAKVNLGLLLLGLGRYEEAWPFYDAGHIPDSKARREIQPPFSFSQWQGESLVGKSLVVVTEQGHGDNIQCARYAALLKARGLRHLSFVQPTALLLLLATAKGIDELTSDAATLPPHDYWCFSLSLPARFGTTVESIPGDLPYLRALPERIERWRPRLSSQGLKVGLVWKGNPNHKNDARRSLPNLSALAPLWDVPDVRFFSLQKGQGEDEAKQPPPGQPIVHLGDEIDNFADSAAIVAQLDLLITVDSAAAHLAGALGKPVWVLLPGIGIDWRWLLDREDSPWYPGVMRLFRQARAAPSWDSTLREVAQALAAWRAAPRSAADHAPPVFSGDLPVLPPSLLGGPPQAPPSVDSARIDTLLQEAHAAFVDGRRSEAEDALRQIISLDRGNAAAWSNLGLLLQESDRAAEAEAAFRTAIELNRYVPEFHTNRGRLQRRLGRLAEAEASLREAIALRPEDAVYQADLGDVLFDMQRFVEAEVAYRRAIALDPARGTSHEMLARTLHLAGRLAEAAAEYRLALTGNPAVRDDLASVLLEDGRWAEAWPYFDLCLEPARRRRSARHPWPEWRGESLAGKALLIETANGNGDDIMCARYAAQAKAAGARRVTLYHRHSLKPLLETVEGVDAVIFDDDPMPPHDFWCFSISLPRRFNATPANIPARLPYAYPLEPRVAYWRRRLSTVDGFRVGLVWKCDANFEADRYRSILDLASLAPLWDIPNASFVSLQTGPGGDDARHPPVEQPILHLGGDVADFADTAAIIAQLDLLISVDAAAAHVAGALGRPVWLLLGANSDWRWLDPQRTDTPWYPGAMRLFRQPRQAPSWDAQVREVAAALAAVVRGESDLMPSPPPPVVPPPAEAALGPLETDTSMEPQMNRPAPRPVAFVVTSSDHGTLIVNRNDYAQQSGGFIGVGCQILANSSFDRDEIDFALRMLESRRKLFGDGVAALDCGANIGVHTIEWARLMHGWGSVIAVEAQERVFYALAGNIAINNCFNARAIWGAVGAENGEILVPRPNYLQPGSFGSLEIRPSARNEFIGQAIDYSERAGQRTRLFTIDSLELPRLDFLKIDIEGMEMEALAGAMNTIRKHRPQMMIEKIKSDENALRGLLVAEGYRVAAFGLNLVAVHASDPSHTQLPT